MKYLKMLAVLSFVFTSNLFSVEHEVKSTSFQEDLERYAEHDYKAENEVFKFLQKQKLTQQSLYDYFLEHTEFNDSDHEDQMPNFDEVVQGAHDLIAEKIKDRFMQGMTEALLQQKKLHEVQDPVFQFVINHQDYDFIKYLMYEWLGQWATLKNKISFYEGVPVRKKMNLFITVFFDRQDILQMLITAHADLNIQDDHDKYTVLILAAEKGKEKCVKMLLEAGANKNITCAYDVTALMLASQAGHEETVRILVNNGVDINSLDVHHCTALMIAAQAGHKEMVNILLKAGADKDIKSLKNETALMAAVQKGRTGIVKKLLKVGADKDVKTIDNKTALDFAVQRDYKKIQEILLHAN
ncbi:ankyrin repeat domain-containing protein [Candidatus Chromulinivorax destructor]|uniref:Uncharacterized protein n=1 Tax=Candidatus Chromulinivorax destructor TaxID=2066483 RepID=A0A345ZBU8_9BACT|nr:ankyrin repeat domain-containing protein [Candidatus Chromulinivorax destructor]AXK60765.1 hypothetical protein C0J27_03380 [Candidatus Chromulinivorax destructor]